MKQIIQNKSDRILIAWLALTFIAGAGITASFEGCANLQPGNDPVVVDAEKTTSIAVESLNTFFKLEASNHALIKQKLPHVAEWTNYARTNSPKWIQTARDMTKAYKANRTTTNKANLQTAVAVLANAINEVKTYTAQVATITP